MLWLHGRVYNNRSDNCHLRQDFTVIFNIILSLTVLLRDLQLAETITSFVHKTCVFCETLRKNTLGYYEF